METKEQLKKEQLVTLIFMVISMFLLMFIFLSLGATLWAGSQEQYCNIYKFRDTFAKDYTKSEECFESLHNSWAYKLSEYESNMIDRFFGKRSSQKEPKT